MSQKDSSRPLEKSKEKKSFSSALAVFHSGKRNAKKKM